MTLKDVHINGTPQDLFPGDPIFAPIRTVLAETSASLVRSLSLYSMWKDHVVSTILKGFQEIRHVLQLSPKKLELSNNSLKMRSAVIQANQENFTEDNEGNTQVRWHKGSGITRTQISFSDLLVFCGTFKAKGCLIEMI